MDTQDLKKEVDKMKREVFERKNNAEEYRIKNIVFKILGGLKYEVSGGNKELIYLREDLKAGQIDCQEEKIWQRVINILKETGLYVRMRESCRSKGYESWEFSLEPF